MKKKCEHCEKNESSTFTLIVLSDWTKAIVWLCQSCYQSHQEALKKTATNDA